VDFFGLFNDIVSTAEVASSEMRWDEMRWVHSERKKKQHKSGKTTHFSFHLLCYHSVLYGLLNMRLNNLNKTFFPKIRPLGPGFILRFEQYGAIQRNTGEGKSEQVTEIWFFIDVYAEILLKRVFYEYLRPIMAGVTQYRSIRLGL